MPLFCAALLILLTACGPKIKEVPGSVPINVPMELRECPDIPHKPAQDATQAGVADFVAQLYYTAVTCKVRHEAVIKIVVTANGEIL